MDSMEWYMESIWNTPCEFHVNSIPFHSMVKTTILLQFIHYSIWNPWSPPIPYGVHMNHQGVASTGGEGFQTHKHIIRDCTHHEDHQDKLCKHDHELALPELLVVFGSQVS